MMKNSFIFLGVLLLGACGQTNKAEQKAIYHSQDEIGAGQLAENVEKLLAAKYTEGCDQAATSMMREMARVLDSKVDEINAFMKTQEKTTNENWKNIPFGDSQLTEYVGKPTADEWLIYRESWMGAFARYQKIKDKPMSQKWVSLNSAVRSMITNDRKRLVYYENLDLNHESPNKVFSLKKVIDLCVEDEKCVVPSYSPADLEFIAQVGNYDYYKKELEEKKTRELLLKFQRSVNSDHEYVGFVKNEQIKVTKSGEKSQLHLQLNAPDLPEQQKKQLQGYMESGWKSDAIELLVEWTDQVKDIYQVFFDITNPGARSHVSVHTKDGLTEKSMTLYPFTSTNAIIHETGHVIGFPDHYYTIWDSESCTYKIQYNEADIMSDSAGRITAAEWEELKKYYQ